MINIKISIIVPIYNVERYLNKCIESILNQSFKDFELILVDDGSTDKSSVICDEYSNIDDRIKVVHKTNGGLSSARNAGLDIAKGEYITFVDGDDYIHKDMYHILYDTITKNKAGIVMCDYKRVFIDENINYDENCVISEKDIDYLNNIECLNNLYSGDKVRYIIVPGKLYKKEIFNNIRFKENKIEEDEFIIHHLLYSARNIVYINKKLYYYIQRNDSIIGSKFNLKRLDKIYALQDRIEFFKEKKLIDLYNIAVKNYIDVFFWNYNKIKNEIPDYRKEIKNIMKSYNEIFYDMILSPKISWRQKIYLTLFKLNFLK